MKTFRALIVLLTALVGCTGAAESEVVLSSQSSTSQGVKVPTTGTLHGQPFAPVDAAVSDFDGLGLDLGLSNTPGFSATVAQGHWPRGFSGLHIRVLSTDAHGKLVVPGAGTYPISGTNVTGNFAEVRYSNEDATCKENLTDKAIGVSGSIVLANHSNAGWSGTYDVVFDDGDHVTGSFSATHCPVLGNFSFSCEPAATPAVSGAVSRASGSIAGTAIAPVDAVMNVRVAEEGGSFASIDLFDHPAICAAARSFHYPSVVGQLLIDVYDSASDDPSTAAPPTAPGVYPVLTRAAAGRGSGGAYYKTDSGTYLVNSQVRGGSVTLTSISGGTYVGSYDFIMDTGDHISGSFSAPYCPDL